MDKYTCKNLIIDPKTQGLEDIIGKEVYYHNTPLLCLNYANENSCIGVLKEIRKDDFYPFRVEIPEEGIFGFVCIIPKKEESEPKYIPFKSKEEFVEKYMQIKEGVAFGPFEDSLLQCGMWLKEKDADYALFMVTEIWSCGVVFSGDMKATEELDGEDFAINEAMTWEKLLMLYTFLDGSPCGKLVEAEHE